MRAALLFCLALATPLAAETPRVVTDIAPVQSLVAQVMKGVGEPGLLVRPGASPHDYNLRPSEAQMLSDADVVIWVGHSITPWLEESLPTIAPGATSVELLDAEGTHLLPNREAEDHGNGTPDGDAHDHDAYDPHAWLDPENARAWVRMIAEDLARRDPEHAETYLRNAADAEIALTDLETRIGAQLASIDGGFVTFHDAFQYFESRFGVSSHSSLSASDARSPGPARIAALRDEVQAAGITCLFAEPQFNPDRVKTLADDLGLRAGTLDPIGADLTPGPELYGRVLTGIAEDLAACLKG